eukprot:12080202-Ditylum_brightwellii.AAC.1
MAIKIPLSNTSSIGQREGIHGRIFRNNTQRLWSKEETNHIQESSSQQHHKNDISDHRKHVIRSFEVHSTNIDEKDPWTGTLSAVRFATRAT